MATQATLSICISKPTIFVLLCKGGGAPIFRGGGFKLYTLNPSSVNTDTSPFKKGRQKNDKKTYHLSFYRIAFIILSSKMLSLTNLSVEIDKKVILDNISMDFELGKNYCIIGKNGSGKSSLAMTIMWHPKYSITNWELRITNSTIWNPESETCDLLPSTFDLRPLSAHERAKLGIFVAFQHIPEIKGIKLFEFLRSIYDAKNDTTTSFLAFKKIIEPLIEELAIDKDFLRRDLNVGFSGGERRKIEILQLKLLQPKYIFLDEIDSWLDVDAFKSVVRMISNLNHSENSFIIITHIFDIIEHVPVDKVYVLEHGKIIQEWDQKIIEKIKKEGFTSPETK